MGGLTDKCGMVKKIMRITIYAMLFFNPGDKFPIHVKKFVNMILECALYQGGPLG